MTSRIIFTLKFYLPVAPRFAKRSNTRLSTSLHVSSETAYRKPKKIRLNTANEKVKIIVPVRHKLL